MFPVTSALKRLFRNIFANAIAGGIAGATYYLTDSKESVLLGLIIGPVINAIGKYIREKYRKEIVI